MLPTHQTCVDRIDACICDLSNNGIDLHNADDQRLAGAVAEHLEYFQLMLGYDSDPAEVLRLLKERAQ